MEENKKITSKKIGLLVLILAVVVCVAGDATKRATTW